MIEQKYILSVNAGSSSIKVTTAQLDDSSVVHSTTINDVTDYSAALTEAIEAIKAINADFSESKLVAVGHRVVHGGSQAETARLIDDALLDEMRRFAEFDPEHAPATIGIIETMRQKFPAIPHVACFDTAFFHDIPRVAQMTTLPRRYEALGLRRYGFHGLSYHYILGELKQKYPEVAKEKVVVAHLGSGSSLAAIQTGAAVDMTMGFSPTSGIMMSSRTGDVDPSIVGFLAQHDVKTADDWTKLTNHESGLLGVSETSADMYTLILSEDKDPRAKEAVALYVYQVRKAIGQLSAAMGGIDRLVFAGGIGEKSNVLRHRIVKELGFLGFYLDESVNQLFNVVAQKEAVISIANSKPIHVVATNENAIIIELVKQTVKF